MSSRVDAKLGGAEKADADLDAARRQEFTHLSTFLSHTHASLCSTH